MNGALKVEVKEWLRLRVGGIGMRFEVVTCVYCGAPTENILELGRGIYTIKMPCCQECIKEIDKLPQRRKNEMAECASIIKMHL